METNEEKNEWVEAPEIEIWYPTVAGDRRTGTFIKTQTLVGDYGPYASVILKDDRGLYRVNGYDIMMKFADANPEPGDLIRLVFTGIMETGRSHLMRTYRVLVKRVPRTPAEPAE